MEALPTQTSLDSSPTSIWENPRGKISKYEFDVTFGAPRSVHARTKAEVIAHTESLGYTHSGFADVTLTFNFSSRVGAEKFVRESSDATPKAYNSRMLKNGTTGRSCTVELPRLSGWSSTFKDNEIWYPVWNPHRPLRPDTDAMEMQLTSGWSGDGSMQEGCVFMYLNCLELVLPEEAAAWNGEKEVTLKLRAEAYQYAPAAKGTATQSEEWEPMSTVAKDYFDDGALRGHLLDAIAADEAEQLAKLQQSNED